MRYVSSFPPRRKESKYPSGRRVDAIRSVKPVQLQEPNVNLQTSQIHSSRRLPKRKATAQRIEP